MEQLSLCQKIAKILYDKKALNITALNVTQLTVITDYMVICSGRSNLQTRALADEVDDQMAQEGIMLKKREGENEGRWIVLDYGSVLVHIFQRDEREHYRLERLWSNGQNDVPLPFIDEEENE